MFPVLAVVQAARSLPSLEVELGYLGSHGAVEQRILASAAIPSRGLSVGGLRGSNPVRQAWNAARLAAAVRPALRYIDELRPDVTFTSGGYVSAPVAIASRVRRVPVLLFSADVSAGLAIRFEARFASRIAVPVPEAAAALPGTKTFVSGYPVRPDLLSVPVRAEAKQQLGFDAGRPLLLLFGGSQGAHSLNQALAAGLDQLLPETQILHVAGEVDAPVLASRPGYRVEAFVNEMPLALAAADLAVSRSGASTLGELPAAGLPAILVPYPYAGGHQKYNAEVLVRAGGALMLENARVPAELVPLILALLRDTAGRERMSVAMRALAKPQAARSIAEALLELAA